MGKRLVLLTTIVAIAASTLAGQSLKSDATGTLRGIVVREDTNEPIGGVRIAIGKGNANAQVLLSTSQAELNKNAQNNETVSRFLQMAADSLAGTDTGRDFNTLTDKDGRFAFEGIPAGEYPVSAEREGYVTVDNTKPPSVARTTTSVASRQTTEIVLKLIPGAAVSGRIEDSNGNAVPNATVEIFRRFDINGTSSTEPLTQRLSDDRGEYRVFQIPPGEYFLAVTSGKQESQPTRRSTRTFYPNTADVSAATSIKLAPGDDLGGVNVQIRVDPEANTPQSDRLNR